MKIYALANELNIDRGNAGAITLPFGSWDYGEKKGVYYRQSLDADGAAAIARQVAEAVAAGEKGIPVYWGHPDVPELAHKYPDKRAKGWIRGAKVADGGLELTVEWLEANATEGFGWFSPYWTGEITENGDGTALMAVNALASVALVNMPNIREFRLANESQDTNAAEAEKGKKMNIDELKKLLGLPPEATEDQVRAAIAELAKAKEAAATEKTKAEAAEAEKAVAEGEAKEAKEALANERAAHVGILLDTAIAEGRISVAGRAAWEKRLTDDFAAGKVALANEKPLKRASAAKELTPGTAEKLDMVALANERMAKHPGMTYTTAFAEVMAEHPEVK